MASDGRRQRLSRCPGQVVADFGNESAVLVGVEGFEPATPLVPKEVRYQGFSLELWAHQAMVSYFSDNTSFVVAAAAQRWRHSAANVKRHPSASGHRPPSRGRQVALMVDYYHRLLKGGGARRHWQ
jgi:hypothetical protein